MQRLTVHAITETPVADRIVVDVLTRVGVHHLGRLRVALPASVTDKQAVAEITAIRHIFSNYKAFSSATGAHREIIVSKGAIKKMMRSASTKHDLYEYGYPLLTRYSEAQISVSKDRSWFPADSESLPEADIVDAEAYRGIDTIETETLGPVGITRHAMEKYFAQCGTISLSSAWKNLARRLRSGLVSVDIPQRVLAHKIKKYGKAPEIWKNESHPLHYVVESRGDIKVVVTVFLREADEELPTYRAA